MNDDSRFTESAMVSAEVANRAINDALQFAPTPGAALSPTEAPQGFIDYVRANYNGVVDIHAPDWHAKRLWAAAMRCVAAPVAVAPSPAVVVPSRELTDTEILDIYKGTLSLPVSSGALVHKTFSINFARAIESRLVAATLATHRQPEDGAAQAGSESIASNEFLGKLLAWINVRHDRTRDEAAYNAIIDYIHSWRERATKEASVQGVPEDVCYELIQNDEMIAGCSGKNALEEIHRYAAQYAQDGPVEIIKCVRTTISAPQGESK